MSLFVIFVFIFCALPAAYSQRKSMTERECVLTEGGEVIWDLRTYQWVCCIPIGEDLEKCIPISDMSPLPKTSLKPLPPKGSKTIIVPKDTEGQTE
jgi:hypothetical protein